MLQQLRRGLPALLGTSYIRVASGAVSTSAATTVAWFSTTAGQSSSSSPSDDSKRRALANKLLYRSKQRGFLELDLLMGLWAEQQIPKMDVPTLQQLSVVLDEENPDLFKWLTGQLPAPEHMTKNQAYAALYSHVSEQLGRNSHPETQAAKGKEWVRGWDDGWRVSTAAKAGEAKASSS